MLTEAEAVEWRGVGRVNIAGYNEKRFCTGVMLDERHVLTAAHCVYDPRSGRKVRPQSIFFVAGYRVGRHVGAQRAEAVAVLPEYRYRGRASLREIAFDVALLRLKSPIPAAVAAPFAVASAFAGPSFSIVSYARDRAHAPSISEGCPLRSQRGVIALLGCDVVGGASGAPVLSLSAGRPQVAAIVSSRGKGPDGEPRTIAVDVRRAVERLRAMLAES